MSTIEARLAELGIELPAPANPAAAYEPTAIAGSQLHVSGQLPLRDGGLVAAGLVGAEVDVEAAIEAARVCAIQVLAQAKSALGDLERIERLAKITVFVASTPGYTQQHVVANGASSLFTDVLGEHGRHSRSAVGMAGLPLGAAVEVEAIFQLRG